MDLFWDWQSKNHISWARTVKWLYQPCCQRFHLYGSSVTYSSIIEMPYNEAVRKFIDMYAVRLRNKVSFMLAATNFYMPIFEEALDLYDLPQELKYLQL